MHPFSKARQRTLDQCYVVEKPPEPEKKVQAVLNRFDHDAYFEQKREAPRTIRELRERGVEWLQQGRFDLAERYFQGIVEVRNKVSPKLVAEAFFALGTIYAEQEDDESALRYTQEGHQLNTGVAEGDYYLGLTVLRLFPDEKKEALKLFRAAFEKNNSLTQALYQASLLHFNLKEYAEALLATQTLLAGQPTDRRTSRVTELQGDIYFAQENYFEAYISYSHIRYPSYPVRYKSALSAYLGKGFLAGWMMCDETLQSIYAFHVETLADLKGKLLFLKGRCGAAVDPKYDTDALKLAERATLYLKEKDQALQFKSELERRNLEENKKGHREWILRWANYLKESGKEEEAVKYCDRALLHYFPGDRALMLFINRCSVSEGDRYLL